MLLVLGVGAVLVVVVGVLVAVSLARKQSADDAAPPSQPADFVAPVSSGGYRFRQPDESPDEFHARVARENADLESRKPT